jgi:dipeptidyl aminopeptidase/acylaminoacyl peptidase
MLARVHLVLTVLLLVTATSIGCASKASKSEKQPEDVSAAPAANQPAETKTDAAPAQSTAPALTESPATEPAEAKATATAAAEKPAAASPAVDTKLIERTVLFGNPDKASARLSPDGKHLSYLAPRDGVMNIFVGPLENPDAAKPVTEEKQRGIRAYFWSYDNAHVLYMQDNKGDEDWHVYSVDVASNTTKDLTAIPKVNAQIVGVSEKFPGEILVGLNDRDPRYHDLYRIDLSSGERKLVEKNPDFAGFVADDNFKARLASKMTEDGGSQYFEPDGSGGWKPFFKIANEDSLTTAPIGFSKSGEILYMTDSRGRNTSALVQLNLKDGLQEVLASNNLADLGMTLVHPTEKNIQAVTFNYERQKWKILDPAIEPDMEYLRGVEAGDLQIASRTLDNKIWIVAYLRDDGPVRYYRYDRPEKKSSFLFTNRKSLEGVPLTKMDPVVIKSRDGLNLVSYLTLPKGVEQGPTGRPKQALPMVLLVHGGPWGRDEWGYDPEHQLLANRGYAVLSVNYRGSTGLGKEFTNAGNKQWAAKMHDDLIDAVDWAVKEKIADAKRVAIMGGSYGGYATLVGLTFTPDVFACGVDLVGPSNLFTLLSTIPPYWAPAMELFKDRVGDPTTDAGKQLLNDRSPLNLVDKIQKPLLIGQGANDPRVKQSESDQIVSAMQKKKIPVTYLLFPDEGHGFARPENNLAFYAVAEAFLARELGGRYQPIGGDFAGSTVTCPEGATQVPGLAEALKEHIAAKQASAGS